MNDSTGIGSELHIDIRDIGSIGSVLHSDTAIPVVAV